MNAISLARPYAEAIFSLALEQGKLEDIAILLENICVIMANPDVSSIMANSSISSKSKFSLFANLIHSKDQQIENILHTLITNKRMELCQEINSLYKKLRDEAEQKQEVLITSAQELSKTQQQKICSNIKQSIQKEVKPIFVVDPTLIGGITIKINDTLTDKSTRGLLNQLKIALINHEDKNYATT